MTAPVSIPHCCGMACPAAAKPAAGSNPARCSDSERSCASRPLPASRQRVTIGSNTFQCSRGAVVSCSAAKPRYRDVLREAGLGQPFVHLAGSVEVVAGRAGAWPGHLMSASLVESQFRTLQPLQDDEIGVTLPLDLSVDDLVAGAAAAVVSAVSSVSALGKGV